MNFIDKKILFALTFIVIIFGFCDEAVFSQENDGYINDYIAPQTTAVFKVNNIDLLYKMNFGSDEFYNAFDGNTTIQKYLIKFDYINFILDYVQEIYFCLDFEYNPYSVMKIKDIENIDYIVESLTSESQKVIRYSGGGIIIKNKNYVDTSFFIYDDVIVFGSSKSIIKIATRRTIKKETIKEQLLILKLQQIFSDYKAWGIILNVKDIKTDSAILSGLMTDELDSIVFVLDYIKNAVRFSTLYRFTNYDSLNTTFEQDIHYDEDKIFEKHIKYQDYLDSFNLDLVKLNTYTIASGEGFVLELIAGIEDPSNIIIPFTQLFINSISKDINYENIIEEIGTKVIDQKLPEKDVLWYDTGYIALNTKNENRKQTIFAKMKFSIQVDNYSIQLFKEVIKNEKEIYEIATEELTKLDVIELFADNNKVKNKLIELLNKSVNDLILSGEVELKIISIEITN